MPTSIESVKKLVRSVLMSSKEGVAEHRFLADYKSLASTELNPKKFGFKGIRDLLQSMPDVARVGYANGVTTYHAVQSKETAHIKSLVSKQNSKKKKSSKRVTSVKCNRPSYRPSPGRYVNPLLPQSSKHRPIQTLPRLVSPLNPPRRTLIRQTPETSGTGNVKRRSTFCRSNNPLRIGPVIVNRIKSVLASNPTGLCFSTLQCVYRFEYGVALPDTVLGALQSSGLARVEEYQSGAEKRYILYPLNHQNLSPEVKDNNSFTINQDTNKISINGIVRNRLKTLLQEKGNGGCTFSELKSLYAGRYSEISDSILHGLECGQITGVARVERRYMGNREYVTFFPIGSSASNPKDSRNKLPGAITEKQDARTSTTTGTRSELPVFITKKEAEKNPGKVSHKFVDSSDEKNATGLQTSQHPTVQAGTQSTKKCLEKPGLSELLSRQVIKGLTADDKVKFPKYPALSLHVPSHDAASNPLELCMEPNSLHYGTITHTCGGSLFYVKVAAYDAVMEKIAINEMQQQRTRSLKAGSYVLANNKRGEVLSVSGKHAQVYFLDYGHVSKLNVAELSDIPHQLLEVPRLAVLCRFDGVCSEDNQAQDAGHKLLEEFMHSKVILDVISTQSECIAERFSWVHTVQCYVRSTSKNLNREVIENVKKSSETVTSSEKTSTVFAGLGLSPPSASLVHHDDASIASQHYIGLQVEAEDEISTDSEFSDSDGDFHQQDTTRVDNDSLKDIMWAGGDNILTNTVLITLPKFPSYRGTLGIMMTVQVTRVVSPGLFYMLPVERLMHLDRITTLITKDFSSDTADFSPCKPSSCDKRMYAAVCQTDSLPIWRRVEVTHINQNRACVNLVDLGQVDCVPVGSIKRLPKELCLVPKLAIAGRLGGIITRSSQESEASKRFREFTARRQLVAHVMDCCLVDDALLFDVSLICTDDINASRCVNDIMVDEWKVSEYMHAA